MYRIMFLHSDGQRHFYNLGWDEENLRLRDHFLRIKHLRKAYKNILFKLVWVEDVAETVKSTKRIITL